MKRLIKLHIKDTDRTFNKAWSTSPIRHDWITNVRISVENMKTILKTDFGLEIADYGFGKQIKKSPYSYSFYVDLWNINDHDENYSIRISNHLPNNFPDDIICNIYTNDYNFVLNSVNKLDIKKSINDIKKLRINEGNGLN